jgi:CDGSH-type Zn-finger protein/truncated hemoglobin YjbI
LIKEYEASRKRPARQVGPTMNTTEQLRALIRDVRTARTLVSGHVQGRLDASVVRPLNSILEVQAETVVPTSQPAMDGGAATAGEVLWNLALQASSLFRLVRSVELFEAAASLQDLACRAAQSDAEAQDRLNRLKTAIGDGQATIRLSPNGPLLVSNVAGFVNWLGEPLPSRPLMALCRCGSSAMKPYCDGNHAKIAFSDAKDSGRVPDRRNTYIGQQVTILDNRGTCQHSGFCTDRLATVFHAKTDPFVTPSGGRMDEIIRAVRDCPSGALSYAVDGVEARDAVDFHNTRPPTIEVTKDGPYRITGGIALEEARGNDVARNAGASIEHFALCRCGHAQNKPFCTGMHWYVEFRDPVRDVDGKPTVYEWAGGLSALTRMTRIFYEKYVPQDDLLAPLFANMSADHPERVAKWLAEVFCGPRYYSAQYGGYPRMLSQHLGKCLNEEMRARWVSLLQQSAKEAGLPNDAEFASAFQSYIAWGSRLAVENSQSAARPAEHMPMPHWDWMTAAGPPGSRISALTPHDKEESPVVLPDADEAVTFANHVKPMFRQRDRQSMRFAFDLWSHTDVSHHAEAILARLRNGSMPCDGAWPQERIAVFARWIASGKPE